jgi:NAD(P) transhydrogenase subunit alpha
MRFPSYSLLFGAIVLLGLLGRSQMPAQANTAKPAPAVRAAAKVAPKKVVAKVAKKTVKTNTANKAKATKKAAANNSTTAKPLSSFMIGLYIFILAIFVGFEIITKVPPTLHTPLMSGANAISGIAIVGALQCARTTNFTAAKILGFLAVVFAMVNVVGGFLVTDRMLKMFSKR